MKDQQTLVSDPVLTGEERGITALAPLGAWLVRAEKFIRRFVILSDDQATAVVLWTAHTHAIAAATVTAYLSITSPEKRSGKTRLLEVLRLLVANPWLTGGTTKAALVRKIHRDVPTLLLDESDAAFNGDKEYGEALRGVLNNGFSRGKPFTTCIGNNHDVQDFNVFCPKAIAGIGRLPDTVEDRAIAIRLKRRARSETVQRFRERNERSEGETIADGLLLSVEPLIDELANAQPELPDELSDRGWDIWEQLLAIADAAGGDWPTRARIAAVRLSSAQEPEDDTLGVLLLADCRKALDAEDADRISSKGLLAYLREIEEAPWGNFKNDKPLSAKTLASILRRFEIKSRTVRFPDETTAKGYLREQFEDSWARYLPSQTSQRHNGSNKPETPLFETSQDQACDGYEKTRKPQKQAVVTGVTAKAGEYAPRGLLPAPAGEIPGNGQADPGVFCDCRIPDLSRDGDGTWRCRRCDEEPAP